MRSLATSCLALLAALAVASVFAGGAAADRMQIDAADQAAANRDVLKASDLPPTVKWKATNPKSPSSADPASCKNLDYSSPSIVDTGVAEHDFTAPGIFVMNRVGLVSKPSMVGLIWKHAFQSSVSRCIDDAFSQGAGGRAKIISSSRLSLPRLTRFQSAYRVVFQIDVKGTPVLGAFDMVVLGSQRTLSLLMVMGIIGSASQQATGERDMTLIDLDLAGKIAARAFNGAGSSGNIA